MTQRLLRLLPAFLLVLAAPGAEAQVMLTKGTNFSVDVAADGRIAMDLVGEIWTLPPGGGEAASLVSGEFSAQRPRWSPDGTSLVYEINSDLWRYDLADGAAKKLSDEAFPERHADWHPDGRRIVFSSLRRDSGFDLWELDLDTRLAWRITHQDGDESDPAWSANGRDLVYVHHHDNAWSLMLRRLGQPDRVLLTSSEQLSSPSWRPDGSLVTFLRHGRDGYSIEMAILSDPLLVREIVKDEDLFVSPVAWAGRQKFFYAANGVIRTRKFNSWTSKTLPFRAWVNRPQQEEREVRAQRRLPPAANQPRGTLVIRTARLFDGVGASYRDGLDIVIDGGRITAVEPHRDRTGAIVVDLGDLTAIPGIIDADTSLPANADTSLGPVLLSFGVTTIVADHANAAELDKLWAGKAMPGPRILSGDWRVDLDSLLSISRSSQTYPVSPAGIRYENAQIADDGEPGMVLSALADSRTAGLEQLLQSRQAGLLSRYAAAKRRFIEKPILGTQSPPIALGSRSSGLPPGIAQHAELRALAEAGLSSEKALRSSGINAANALGLGLQVGRIAPGASADLVIVDGDPLKDVADAQNIVGIVRNGRFFSAIGLIERAEILEIVE